MTDRGGERGPWEAWRAWLRVQAITGLFWSLAGHPTRAFPEMRGTQIGSHKALREWGALGGADPSSFLVPPSLKADSRGALPPPREREMGCAAGRPWRGLGSSGSLLRPFHYPASSLPGPVSIPPHLEGASQGLWPLVCSPRGVQLRTGSLAAHRCGPPSPGAMLALGPALGLPIPGNLPSLLPPLFPIPFLPGTSARPSVGSLLWPWPQCPLQASSQTQGRQGYKLLQISPEIGCLGQP